MHMMHAWLVRSYLLRTGLDLSPIRGGGATSIFGACRICFKSSNMGHMLVGCPASLQNK